jgi:N,N'-diacetyllegionaminate synthase
MTKIIAEFCQNHNGNIELLARMIEQAASAGATHGKMQTIMANTISYRPQFEEGLVVDGIVKSIKRPYAEEYSRLKTLEINRDETLLFIKYCKENGLIPITTCFTRSHIKELAEVGFESIKVASYDCASFPMLRELTEKFDEIVVSTGATFDDEVIHAADILAGTNFAFLHCVTLYPTPLNEMHLLRMNWLRSMAPKVGFSDHTLVERDGLIASKGALALGAEIIERHFTILGPTESKDGPISVTPRALAELADFGKMPIEDRLSSMDSEHPEWRIMLGEEKRLLSDEELLNRDYYRGRFATPREESRNGSRMIFNWEETPI